ncbi:MAG TPA: NAD-dependent epimerase/dehydratase family protein [Vicinamibacteria bacterium]|nr:NAD-dependent epimerase/dehydratase family protein [Vicinamibacteria bacterium]
MRILVAGACGFVGSTLARAWVEAGSGHSLVGIDSFARPGSEVNRLALREMGIEVRHADLRFASDLEGLPDVDAVVDAAGNPCVLAGVDGRTSSRQLVEHNLLGTVNLLELCRRRRAAFVLLSTSRVYSIRPLAGLPTRVRDGAFEPDPSASLPAGVSPSGIAESFPTAPPVSLYGSTKAASEHLALEYGETYSFPVWVDRCGILAGGGQFGRPDQGIFAFWVNAWLRRRPLTYTGFGGSGHQVRDCLHPADLVPLIDRQLASVEGSKPRTVNVSGGQASALSLRQLSEWCRERLFDREVAADARPRPFDLPWVVLDPSLARETWGFAPSRGTKEILEEIVRHAEAHPEWLELSETS